MLNRDRAFRMVCLALGGACLTQIGTCLFQLFAPIASLGESYGLSYLFAQAYP